MEYVDPKQMQVASAHVSTYSTLRKKQPKSVILIIRFITAFLFGTDFAHAELSTTTSTKTLEIIHYIHLENILLPEN